MPILPTAEKLGRARSSATRSIATIRNPGVVASNGAGEGFQALGQAAESFGEEAMRQRDATELVEVENYTTKATIELDKRLKGEGNYGKHVSIFNEEQKKIQAHASELISNPLIRKRWQLKAEGDLLKRRESVRKRAVGMQKVARANKIHRTLQDKVQIYSDPEIPIEERQKVLSDIRANIEVARRSGLISPDEAEKWNNKYVNGAIRVEAETRLLSDARGLHDELTKPKGQRSDRYGDLTPLERLKFIDRAKNVVAAEDKLKSQNAMVNALMKGQASFSPHDTEAKKTVNDAFNARYGPEVDFTTDMDAQKAVLGIASNNNFVPKRVSARILGGIQSNNPELVTQSLRLADKLKTLSPSGFAAMNNNSKIDTDLEAYRHVAGLLGEEAAVQHIIASRDSVAKRQNRSLREDADKFVKSIAAEDVRGVFDAESWFEDPKVSFSPVLERRLLDDYRFFARNEFLSRGDVELAKGAAIAHMKKTYGVTRITGQATLMRFPPDGRFFSGPQLKVVKKQFVDTAKAAEDALKKTGIKIYPGEAFIASDQHTYKTVQDFESGKTRTEELITSNGERTQKRIRATPEWKLYIMADRDGQKTPVPVGYFGAEGLLQEDYNRKQKIFNKNNKLGRKHIERFDGGIMSETPDSF